MDDQRSWGELRSAVARHAWCDAEQIARGDDACMAYLMAYASRVAGGVRAVEHWRIVGELEQSLARDEVWNGRDNKHGERWRHDDAPFEVAGYCLEVEREGDSWSGHYVARVFKGDGDDPIDADDLSASADDDNNALELEAQAFLARVMWEHGPVDEPR